MFSRRVRLNLIDYRSQVSMGSYRRSLELHGFLRTTGRCSFIFNACLVLAASGFARLRLLSCFVRSRVTVVLLVPGPQQNRHRFLPNQDRPDYGAGARLVICVGLFLISALMPVPIPFSVYPRSFRTVRRSI
jgi:hypothetical protein